MKFSQRKRSSLLGESSIDTGPAGTVWGFPGYDKGMTHPERSRGFGWKKGRYGIPFGSIKKPGDELDYSGGQQNRMHAN